MLTAAAPRNAPAAEAVMARAGGENFPVASRVLPRPLRAHLLAVYGFARLVDELGDADAGGGVQDRLAALDWLERELDRAFGSEAESSVAAEEQHPLLVRLAATVRECGLSREPFARLIEANRVDQRVSRYETWAQLRGYCALSADPVGEIVLGVLGLSTPERVALSDSICTALQLAEHCQDVAEDLARGRIYLPAEDMRRFSCTESDLAGAHASEPLREVLAFEVARARALLADGLPLIAQLRGRARLAVAAFAAGGSAALEAIERARYDVLAGPPRAGRARRAAALVATLRASRVASRRAHSVPDMGAGGGDDGRGGGS
jgi:squalene synthase HpnC